MLLTNYLLTVCHLGPAVLLLLDITPDITLNTHTQLLFTRNW